MAEPQLSVPYNLNSIADKAKALSKYSDVGFALAIIGIIMVLLFPVPTGLLDFLLAVSITSSVVILMTCLFINKPLDLSVFPTLLLVTAVLRLSLNIASTRLILANGHTGTAAAGHVIEAFGGFIMQGNIVIGVILFIMLTIINFIVITKGSGRIAEVAARFSLDAMPGKQMAIDADLSAGLIDEASAKQRRKELEEESTFYGAMDGANKFVRGDAIAGLLITFINFVAGIIIGVVQRNLTFDRALHTYTILTIGDGLVSQIPSLIISLSAGLLVSKSGFVGSTEKAIFGQLGKHPQTLWLSSALLVFMSLMPGIPAAPFMLIAIICGALGWYLQKESKVQKISQQSVISQEQGKEQQKAAAKPQEEAIAETLHIDSIKLELGYSLLPLINYQKGHKLTEQIKSLRKQMARELGFIIPSVRIQDNMQLPSNSYSIKIKDIECGRADVKPDMLLIMDPKGQEINLVGEKTKEPAFGLPAMWVAENLREEALFKNYTVIDPPTVITTHITEVIKENIIDLLSYSETQKLLDEIGDEHKKLVADVVSNIITVSGLQRVLQNLLSEMVSIRDLPTILEAIAEIGRSATNTMITTEHVRMRLSRQISNSNTTNDGYIPVLILSPMWEQVFAEGIVAQGEERQLSVPPTKLQDFIGAVKKAYEDQATKGNIPVLLVSPIIRAYIRGIIERFRPSTVVLSQNEIHAKAKIKTLGQV